MASLYPKKNSPYWHIHFKNPAGKWANKSTGFRRDNRQETILAKKLVHEMEFRGLVKQSKESSIQWGKWVEEFFKRRCKSKLTLERYLDGWKWCYFYFIEKKIIGPAFVNYQTALDYIEWRTSYKKKTGRVVSKNTALLEVKILSLVLQECVKLGYIQSNKIQKLGIPRDIVAEKPALSDEEIIICKKALLKEPDWMRISFEISLNTGCRLRETAIPLNCIDSKRDMITFPTPKGGKKRAFSIPIPDGLRPTINEILKRRFIVAFPFQPSRRWQQFFKKVELPHLCFHCLRVTFVTRLAQEGVPLSVAMKLVNHGSELVHRIYVRLTVDDLRPYANSVRLPSLRVSNAKIRRT